MKGLPTSLLPILFAFLPLKAVSNACEYAGSNISYISSQTQKAIEAEKMSMVHYYAYKALSAIEKSKQQFKDCGCEYAEQNIEEGKKYLKKAIKVSTVMSSRVLLKKSLENTMGSLEALEDHQELHGSEYGNDLLVMNTNETKLTKKNYSPTEGKALESIIDSSLKSFKVSLEKVVKTVDCEQALDYVQQVYTRCELELLKTDLTEGKRYYNLKTKEIAKEALADLQVKCAQN